MMVVTKIIIQITNHIQTSRRMASSLNCFPLTNAYKVIILPYVYEKDYIIRKKVSSHNTSHKDVTEEPNLTSVRNFVVV